MKALISFIWRTIVLVLAVIYAVSCTLTISPDGAKSFSIDAKAAIEILNQK